MSSCRITIDFLLNAQGDKRLDAPTRLDSRFSQPDPGSERQQELSAKYSPPASNEEKPINEPPGANNYVCPLNACGLRFSSSRRLPSHHRKAHLMTDCCS